MHGQSKIQNQKFKITSPFPGYSECTMGKQSRRRPYRPYSHSFWGTLLWVIPCMAVLLFVGFIAGRDVIAPRFLHPGKMGTPTTRPVRVLSPEEARLAARDEDSHVWTRGVQPSDIPKLELSDENPRPRRRSRRVTPAEPATPVPAVETPSTPAAEPEQTDETEPPVTPAPENNDDSPETYIPQD